MKIYHQQNAVIMIGELRIVKTGRVSQWHHTKTTWALLHFVYIIV